MYNMKLSVKNYWHPTPLALRKLGDSLLAVSTFIVGYSILEQHKWLAFTALGLGVLGKFLTNFFKNEPPDAA
jgi:hypothetical protein